MSRKARRQLLGHTGRDGSSGNDRRNRGGPKVWQEGPMLQVWPYLRLVAVPGCFCHFC